MLKKLGRSLKKVAAPALALGATTFLGPVGGGLVTSAVLGGGSSGSAESAAVAPQSGALNAVQNIINGQVQAAVGRSSTLQGLLGVDAPKADKPANQLHSAHQTGVTSGGTSPVLPVAALVGVAYFLVK